MIEREGTEVSGVGSTIGERITGESVRGVGTCSNEVTKHKAYLGGNYVESLEDATFFVET